MTGRLISVNAVHAYAIEETRLREQELGRELGPGAFGESLGTEGVDVSGAVLGRRRWIGTTLLEGVQPRLPCFTLGPEMGDRSLIPRAREAPQLIDSLREQMAELVG